MVQAILNGAVFDGESLHEQCAVIVDGACIREIVAADAMPADVTQHYDLAGRTLIPGFIDLQVNGGGGHLFSDNPCIETLRVIGAAHRACGTTGFLPTLITSSVDVMRSAIEAVERALAEGVPGVLGIHLEGPFLNAQRSGVHDAGKFCELDEAGFELVTSLQRGKTLLTLAPELASPVMIRRLVERGVIVSAGHSAANYAQCCEALAAGVTGFTHLFNTMTPLQSREPGMVGAALADDDSWFGIIADGHHVHPATFRVAVRAKQRGGALLVTDAMPTVGAQSKQFSLNGEIITASEGRVTNAAGMLAGSDLDMLSAVNNAAQFAGIDWFEAVRMASVYPARALGVAHELGAIKPGYRANLVALGDDRRVSSSWIDGIRV